MFAEVIILTIMGIALLAWVIFCGIQFIRHGRDLAAEAGFVGHVKCEKCGTEYEVSSAEFTKSYMSKYKSVTRTKKISMPMLWKEKIRTGAQYQ